MRQEAIRLYVKHFTGVCNKLVRENQICGITLNILILPTHNIHHYKIAFKTYWTETDFAAL